MRLDSFRAGTNYVVYREQPTLTINADDETVIYGTAPALVTSVSGQQNGDTALQALSSAATVSVSGSTSASGNYTAGTKTLTASGAADQLGYGLAYTTGTLTVNQKALTVSGITAVDKVYDGGIAASVNGSGVDFSGIIVGDDLTLVSASGTFIDKNAGAGKTVTIVSTYSGVDASNYTITDQASATATITPKALTATYVGDNKVYDGTETARVTGSSTDIISGDLVSFSNTAATFTDKNVGANKTVTVNGIVIAGDDADNYALTATTASDTAVDITPKALTVSGIMVADKVYDGNITAVTNGSGAIFSGMVTGDSLTLASLSGTFSDENVGSGKTVSLNSSYSGADVGNYNITDQLTTIAKFFRLYSLILIYLLRSSIQVSGWQLPLMYLKILFSRMKRLNTAAKMPQVY